MIAMLRWVAWGVASCAALALIAQPVSVQAQLALSLSVIAAMIGTWTFGRGPWVRQIMLALGSLVILRYIYWRTTSTLPPITEPVDFIPGVILYTAELYCFLILCISMLINADPLVRKPLERSDDSALPTVDVFIPSYNEDSYILATTIAAAKSMDYPAEKLTVWLCDDGGTDQKCNDKDPAKAEAARERRRELMALCEQLGANYHTRARNEHAKAGNMNACLKDSHGELVVVFDADHAPFRMFLRETVGHFLKDEKLFLVQTPHVFLNPDPIEKNLRTFDRMPSENEMFYSVTQRGLDKWDGSFFCGSAAVLRRKALEQTNGFSGITITEDCETAFELHASGWRSAYVDKPLIAGLQPETFTSFIGQRSRWCQGMFQILLLKNPAFKRGLSFVQRIAYLSSMTFWFFPLPRLIFMLAPLLYIFLDIKIFVSNIQETIAYTLTYLIVNVLVQNYMYGKVRWPWVSELYEYVQGVFLAKAIVTVIANPRKPTFNVTAKGLTLDKDHLSELAWPFFAMYGLLLLGSVTAVLRYAFEPGINSLMLVVGLWNLFNLTIAGAALGAVAERRQPDRHPRLGIERTGLLRIEGRIVPVDIVNVSAGGVALRPRSGETMPDVVDHVTRADLRIDPVGPHAGDCVLPLLARRSETQQGGLSGFEFADMQAQHYYVLADLMYGDSDALPRFLKTRRAHKDVVRGSAQFMMWGLLEPVRSFAYLLHEKFGVATGAVADSGAQAPAPEPTTPEPAAPAPLQPAIVVSAPAVALAPLAVVAPLRELEEDPLVVLLAATRVTQDSVERARPDATDPSPPADAIDGLRRLLQHAKSRTPAKPDLKPKSLSA